MAGLIPIPADCGIAWQRLAELQAGERSFNLIYLPGQLYCLARRRQGEYLLPDWCGGQAWYELAAGVVAFSAAAFEALEAGQIAGAVAFSRLPPSAVQVALHRVSRLSRNMLISCVRTFLPGLWIVVSSRFLSEESSATA